MWRSHLGFVNSIRCYICAWLVHDSNCVRQRSHVRYLLSKHELAIKRLNMAALIYHTRWVTFRCSWQGSSAGNCRLIPKLAWPSSHLFLQCTSMHYHQSTKDTWYHKNFEKLWSNLIKLEKIVFFKSYFAF